MDYNDNVNVDVDMRGMTRGGIQVDVVRHDRDCDDDDDT